MSLNEVKKKLEHYCAYQERCHKEVKQKLRELGVQKNAKDVIITKLIETDYLNETRFAKSFVRGKFRIKNWGKIRIIRELKIREISDWNIKNALKEISDEKPGELKLTSVPITVTSEYLFILVEETQAPIPPS